MELVLLLAIAAIVMMYRGYNGKNAVHFINDHLGTDFPT